MTQPCYQSLRCVRIRVSKINSTTGAPVNGASNGVVSSSQIQCQLGLTLTTGDTGTTKNGDGVVCATFTDPDTLKNVALTLDLCSADPILRALMLSATTFIDPGHASTVMGMQSLGVGVNPTPVCFELWTRAWDGTAQTTAAVSTSPNAAYWHWVFPWVTWVEDTTTLSNGIHSLPLKGIGVANSGITANGPFNDWPVAIADQGGVTSPYGYFLDSAIPAATCGYTSVPSGS
jgi:hypothetical protein